MSAVGLRIARIVGLILTLGLFGTGLGRYWVYRMEPFREDGIRFPWGEAFPFLVAGFIVLSVSIVAWTDSPDSSQWERRLYISAAAALLAVGIWGASALKSDEVVEGVHPSGEAGPSVTAGPAITDSNLDADPSG